MNLQLEPAIKLGLNMQTARCKIYSAMYLEAKVLNRLAC